MILCHACGHDFSDDLICECGESVISFRASGTELRFGVPDPYLGVFALTFACRRNGELRGDYAAGRSGFTPEQMERHFREAVREALVRRVISS